MLWRRTELDICWSWRCVLDNGWRRWSSTAEGFCWAGHMIYMGWRRSMIGFSGKLKTDGWIDHRWYYLQGKGGVVRYDRYFEILARRPITFRFRFGGISILWPVRSVLFRPVQYSDFAQASKQAEIAYVWPNWKIWAFLFQTWFQIRLDRIKQTAPIILEPFPSASLWSNLTGQPHEAFFILSCCTSSHTDRLDPHEIWI